MFLTFQSQYVSLILNFFVAFFNSANILLVCVKEFVYKIIEILTFFPKC